MSKRNIVHFTKSFLGHVVIWFWQICKVGMAGNITPIFLKWGNWNPKRLSFQRINSHVVPRIKLELGISHTKTFILCISKNARLPTHTKAYDTLLVNCSFRTKNFFLNSKTYILTIFIMYIPIYLYLYITTNKYFLLRICMPMCSASMD